MDDATRAAWRRHLGEDADPDALRAELAAGTMGEAFAATARERGDAPALEIDGAAASHAELDDRAASSRRGAGARTTCSCTRSRSRTSTA
jgi:hypothetical protein